MAEKAIQVIETISRNSEVIEDIVYNSGEYYFRYMGHSFSILFRSSHGSRKGTYIFYMYPRWQGSTSSLANAFASGSTSDDIPLVAYSSETSPELPFATLYDVIKSRFLQLDDLFDDILGPSADSENSDDIPF